MAKQRKEFECYLNRQVAIITLYSSSEDKEIPFQKVIYRLSVDSLHYEAFRISCFIETLE